MIIYVYIIKKERLVLWIEYGICVILEFDIWWLCCDIKLLNLLLNVLVVMKVEWKGCKEVFFVRNGIVMEGSYFNFFLIKNGIFYIYLVNYFILNGIIC